MNKTEKNLISAAEQLLDRLNYHGSIDLIREEAPIQDLLDAISESKHPEIEEQSTQLDLLA